MVLNLVCVVLNLVFFHTCNQTGSRLVFFFSFSDQSLGLVFVS